VREAEFWRLIESMNGQTDDDSFRALCSDLEALEPEELASFRTHLLSAMAKVTTPAHLRQDVRDYSEPEEPEAHIPLTGSAAVGAACAVIIAGRKDFDEVVRDPRLLRGRRPIAAAAQLLDVVEEINAESQPPPLTRRPGVGWLNFFGYAWMTLRPSNDAYIDKLNHFVDKVSTDPKWVRWAEDSGFPYVRLHVQYDEGEVKERISTRLDKKSSVLHVSAYFSVERRMDDTSAATRALADFAAIMEAITSRSKVPPPANFSRGDAELT